MRSITTPHSSLNLIGPTLSHYHTTAINLPIIPFTNDPTNLPYGLGFACRNGVKKLLGLLDYLSDYFRTKATPTKTTPTNTQIREATTKKITIALNNGPRNISTKTTEDSETEAYNQSNPFSKKNITTNSSFFQEKPTVNNTSSKIRKHIR